MDRRPDRPGRRLSGTGAPAPGRLGWHGARAALEVRAAPELRAPSGASGHRTHPATASRGRAASPHWSVDSFARVSPRRADRRTKGGTDYGPQVDEFPSTGIRTRTPGTHARPAAGGTSGSTPGSVPVE